MVKIDFGNKSKQKLVKRKPLISGSFCTYFRKNYSPLWGGRGFWSGRGTTVAPLLALLWMVPPSCSRCSGKNNLQILLEIYQKIGNLKGIILQHFSTSILTPMGKEGPLEVWRYHSCSVARCGALRLLPSLDNRRLENI